MADDLIRRYRGRVIFEPFTPVDPNELAALESEIGGALPDAYRAFLEAAHGGRLEYSIRLPEPAGGDAVGFDDFFRVGRDRNDGYGYGTLIGEYRRRAEPWWAAEIPVDHLLPIARDGGSNTLYLDLGSEHRGRLVAFVRGLPAWTGPRDAYTVVADSFDDYLDNLFIDVDIAQMTWDDLGAGGPSDEWRRAVEAWLDDGVPHWRSRFTIAE